MTPHVILHHSWLAQLERNDHPLYQRKHGFDLSSAGTKTQNITYDVSTRKITVTPTGTTFTFWIDGKRFTKVGAQLSGAHANTTGTHFFYYDANGVLQVSTSAWSVVDRTITPVAAVYFNTTGPVGTCYYECHTADRWLEGHYNHHFSVGAVLVSGFSLAGYLLNTDTDAGVTPSVASGIIADEDLIHSISAVADGGPYCVFYRSGAAGDWTLTVTDVFPFKSGVTFPQWNEFTGATWQLTELSGLGLGQWCNYYIGVTPSVQTDRQIVLFPGQARYTSLAAAQAETIASLAFGALPFQEFAPVWRITFHALNTHGGTHKVKIESVTAITAPGASVTASVSPTVHNSLSGRSDPATHPGSSVSNTPAGGITSTDVQAALNELDTTKVDISGDVMSGDLAITVAATIRARHSPLAFELREDFLSGTSATSQTIGALGWSFYTSSGGVTLRVTPGTSNHPGIQRLQSGVTLNAITALHHHESAYTFVLSDIGWVTWIGKLSTVGGRASFILTPDVTADNPNGTVGFEVATGDANWYSVTVDGGGTTRKDTGIPFSSGVWHRFEAFRTGAQTWSFYVDGTFVTAHTGGAENVPSDTTAVQVVMQMKSDGTSRSLDADLIDVYGEVTR